MLRLVTVLGSCKFGLPKNVEGVVEVEPLATSPSVRVLHAGPCYPCTQYVGLPYMAHESHTEDTTFIVAESDFVFNHSDATTHLQWQGEEEEKGVSCWALLGNCGRDS